MDRENLKKSGLLEQYVLGLTNRKESIIVERALEEDPEIMKDYQKLRDELNEYVGRNGMMVPEDGREQRTARDFEELDHEMISAMTERTQKLLIWRYVLGAACLVLLCLSGFLFRLSENNRHATVTEKAMHAQDNHHNDIVVKDLREKNNKWTELKTLKVPAEGGIVLLHLLTAQELLLLDLSHLSPLPEGFGYFVYLGKAHGGPSLVIPAGGETDLREIAIHDQRAILTIYRGPLEGDETPSSTHENHLVATFALTGNLSLAD
jgi:anti-sigma-K factor RskA